MDNRGRSRSAPNEFDYHYLHDHLDYEAERLQGEMTQEIKKTIPALLAEHVPDFCNAACGLWGVIVPAIAEEVKKLGWVETGGDQMPGLKEMNAPVWNYVDTGASIFLGILLLLDDENHRQRVTKLKGVINISSGITLGIITGVSTTMGAAAGAALASQALAAAIGVSFVLACEDVAYSVHRIVSPKYWLKDTMSKLDRLERVTIPKMEEQIREDKARYEQSRTENFRRKPNKKERLLLFLINRKIARLKHLKQHSVTLKNDIKDRIEGNAACHEYYMNDVIYQENPLAWRVKSFVGFNPVLDTNKGKKIEEKVSSQCRRELKNNLKTALFIGVLFAGTLALCIPGGQLVGTVLLGIFTSWFTLKHGNTIRKVVPKAVKNTCNYASTFFKERRLRKEKERNESFSINSNRWNPVGGY